MEESISFIELQDADGGLARQAFAIYEASFPPAERDPIEDLVELIQRSALGRVDQETNFRFFVGVSGEEVLGLAVYTYHARLRLGYLAYLATTAVFRGQGLGSWMFTQTIDRLRQEAEEPPLGMCWEVERPSDIQDAHESELAERRIRFYQRNGSILFPDVDLLTPALADNLPEVHYHLMYYPLENSAGIGAEQVQSLIDLILLEGYGVSRDSHYYQRAIRSISETVYARPD
ncbi:MAG: GNAT family N-acetyltransferase [Chloroflexi bacterium]|nr:GNAT family N-acetyltransferase [Chloroflexota bacterium]